MTRTHSGGPADDPYAVLGVDPSAPAAEITAAFRRRVRELRPDTRVDPVTAERFGRVRDAYETLRDPGRRAAHDRGRAPAPPPAPARPARRATVPEPPLRAGPVRWDPAP
ncbi:J domain-containing protein [Streptomyces sp. NPDC085946]|uniref:J domain-containing protein n=1 Tax=Streptomyces sp. NPDC085946 TaxID=3365744 RepID=UPI0037D29D61